MTTHDPNTPVDVEHLTERVLAVEGITRLFASENRVARAVGMIATTVAGNDSHTGHVGMTSHGTGRVITARIAVHEKVPAPHAARAVADQLLQDVGGTELVHVEVAHIHAGPPPAQGDRND